MGPNACHVEGFGPRCRFIPQLAEEGGRQVGDAGEGQHVVLTDASGWDPFGQHRLVIALFAKARLEMTTAFPVSWSGFPDYAGTGVSR